MWNHLIWNVACCFRYTVPSPSTMRKDLSEKALAMMHHILNGAPSPVAQRTEHRLASGREAPSDAEQTSAVEKQASQHGFSFNNNNTGIVNDPSSEFGGAGDLGGASQRFATEEARQVDFGNPLPNVSTAGTFCGFLHPVLVRTIVCACSCKTRTIRKTCRTPDKTGCFPPLHQITTNHGHFGLKTLDLQQWPRTTKRRCCSTL